LYQIKGEPQREIKGYATPKQSLRAVSFDVRFTLKRVEPMENGRDGAPGSIRVGGTCSHERITGEVSDTEIGDYAVWAGNSIQEGRFGWVPK
jgi:hypothetical protein